MTTQPTPGIAGARPSKRTAFSRWRTSDILVTASIGVVFGVVFFFWNVLWAATKPAFTFFPPAHAFMYGIWLVPGVLAPYLTRKAGSGILAETVAGVVSVIFGGGWAGGIIVLYGIGQGVSAEIGYAVAGYRSWRKVVVVLAGATAGIFPAIMDNVIYYPTWTTGWQLTYAIVTIASSAVLGSLISIGLARTLQRSGALPARRD
jgi:energy-coupling factor transport system substrate-specific component